jgi:hypothetical protein
MQNGTRRSSCSAFRATSRRGRPSGGGALGARWTRGDADLLLTQRTGDPHGSRGRRGPAAGLESRTWGRVLELGPVMVDRGARWSRRSGRSRGGRGLGVGRQGGKKENETDFLKTRYGSCFSENCHTRVFVAAHKRAVIKRRRKHSLFGRGFAFLAKNQIKIKIKQARSRGQNKKVALLAGGVLG